MYANQYRDQEFPRSIKPALGGSRTGISPRTGLILTPAQRIKPTKVADGLGALAKPYRKKLSDAEVKRRIGAHAQPQPAKRESKLRKRH